ncbi:TauD/TfdA dioxygenase family protein [Sphingopyxis sp.]|uniref:TauD/TfdA dioxygenase family protein n=1 Tax=Sphingopyxis sp. TaxID=1908224 RepID=UPI003D6CB835
MATQPNTPDLFETARSLGVGVSEEDSDSLLRLLFDRIKVPEYQVRFRWPPNAIGIWDNRSTQHYAVGDYWPGYRALERVTVFGCVVTR